MWYVNVIAIKCNKGPLTRIVFIDDLKKSYAELTDSISRCGSAPRELEAVICVKDEATARKVEQYLKTMCNNTTISLGSLCAAFEHRTFQ